MNGFDICVSVLSSFNLEIEVTVQVLVSALRSDNTLIQRKNAEDKMHRIKKETKHIKIQFLR